MRILPIVLLIVLFGFSDSAYSNKNLIDVRVDPVAWSIIIGQSYKPDSAAFTGDQRNLLEEIRPLIEAKDYAQAQTLIEYYTGPLPAVLLRLKGQIYLAQNNYDSAVNTLLEVNAFLPNDIVNLQNLATAYLLQEDFANAQTFLSLSISNGANNAQVYGQLGYINVKTSMPVSAVAAYQKALMFQPNNKQWYTGLLFALINSRANEQAMHLINQLLDNSPNDSKLWLQRAQLALNMNRNSAALSSLESAYVLGENTSNVVLQIAMLHIENGSAQRAVALIDDNKKRLFVAQNADIYFQQIYVIGVWLAQNQQNAALESLTSLLAKQTLNDTNLALTYYLQGQVALNKQNDASALTLFEKSLQLDPSNGDVLLSLARLYVGKNNPIKAEMLYSRAQSFVKYKEQASLGLAQIAIERKDYAGALMLLRNVYQANPSQVALLRNISVLENLIVSE